MGISEQANAGSASGEILDASRDQAVRLGLSLRERAIKSADRRKGDFVGGLEQLAGKLEGLGEDESIGQVARFAVSAARRAASVLDSSSTEELLERGSQQVRERPGLFIAGCLGLGFLGARLLRK